MGVLYRFNHYTCNKHLIYLYILMYFQMVKYLSVKYLSHLKRNIPCQCFTFFYLLLLYLSFLFLFVGGWADRYTHCNRRLNRTCYTQRWPKQHKAHQRRKKKVWKYFPLCFNLFLFLKRTSYCKGHFSVRPALALLFVCKPAFTVKQ